MKTEVEAGAPVNRRFRPDLTTVAMDDALNHGQADTAARELRFRMQAFEGTEQVGRMSRVESSAIVAHEVGTPSRAIDPRAEFDSGIRILEVNFQALDNRFSNAIRSNAESPSTIIPSATTTETFRSGALSRELRTMSFAMRDRSTVTVVHRRANDLRQLHRSLMSRCMRRAPPVMRSR